ncbi:hypothetical protein L1889_10100 [Paenalcaligenes niemegkensis]|uniref:hypothetical protein n=1 Tax=Paenalcaligenes niemegkensis TaxID=2895469 RepID=UPI001EE7D712|nr:hypothetical protein [Paenalcaligenes niemegkensis]MCQ9617009.1 hypothetical protein [Paenalcaligenes niemegkensis]
MAKIIHLKGVRLVAHQANTLTDSETDFTAQYALMSNPLYDNDFIPTGALQADES